MTLHHTRNVFISQRCEKFTQFGAIVFTHTVVGIHPEYPVASGLFKGGVPGGGKIIDPGKLDHPRPK